MTAFAIMVILTAAVAQLPADTGPIYAETDMSRFPVEPFNTFSLVIFLVIAAYWSRKLGRQWRKQRLIAWGVLLLVLGFIGGTAYHACRCSQLWFYLDIGPIVLLVLMAGIAYWRQLHADSRKLFAQAVIIMVVATLGLSLSGPYLSRQTLISISYIQLAALLLLPAFLSAWFNRGTHFAPLVCAALAFTAAIAFRIADFLPGMREYFPHGTHFLWHLMGGSCAHCMLLYSYRRAEAMPGKTVIGT